MSPARIAILISGRGSNMVAILEQVRQGTLSDCCEVALVCSNRPKAAGLAKARELGVPTLVHSSLRRPRQAYDRELLELLEPHALDYLVLAGFMRILSPQVVRRYAGRVVNIHPADTAQHQGLHGYRWAWDKRLPSTAVTVHLVDEGLDTGPVLAKKTVDLRGARNLEEVEARGLAVEHRFYSQVLRELFLKRAQVTMCAES